MIWSASMGPPFCRSRYIDDVWVEPRAVKSSRAAQEGVARRLTDGSHDRDNLVQKPMHEVKAPRHRRNLADIPATMRHVIPPMLARRIHFSHISRSIESESVALKIAPCMAA